MRALSISMLTPSGRCSLRLVTRLRTDLIPFGDDLQIVDGKGRDQVVNIGVK